MLEVDCDVVSESAIRNKIVTVAGGERQPDGGATRCMKSSGGGFRTDLATTDYISDRDPASPIRHHIA